MQKMQTKDEEVPDMKSEEKKDIAQMKNISKKRSYESLWGAMLFASMLLFVVASVASIGWGVYSKWKGERTVKARPSISVLSQQSGEAEKILPVENAKASENESSKQSEDMIDEKNLAAAKKMLISVLNGGAAKGSAGTVVTFLKTEGYVNVTPGNTLKDYAGITIYYAASLEKEAEVIKASVIKKYPQVKILPADEKNTETSISQITIILGK